MVKRIRLTIDWAGACSESTWAAVLAQAIEETDASGLTKVSDVELVTDFGTTEPLTLIPDHRDPFLTPFEVRRNRRRWGLG